MPDVVYCAVEREKKKRVRRFFVQEFSTPSLPRDLIQVIWRRCKGNVKEVAKGNGCENKGYSFH